MLQRHRITVLILKHKYRNIIVSYSKECDEDDELKRNLLSEILFLEKRYPEANILVDNGKEILYEIKSGVHVSKKISMNELNAFYKKHKIKTDKEYSCYEEFREYSALIVSVSDNIGNRDLSTVIVFDSDMVLNLLFKISKERLNVKVNLFIQSILTLIIKNGKIYQKTNQLKYYEDSHSDKKYMQRLWNELASKILEKI